MTPYPSPRPKSRTKTSVTPHQMTQFFAKKNYKILKKKIFCKEMRKFRSSFVIYHLFSLVTLVFVCFSLFSALSRHSPRRTWPSLSLQGEADFLGKGTILSPRNRCKIVRRWGWIGILILGLEGMFRSGDCQRIHGILHAPK